MEITWTDRVKNKVAIHRVNEERIVLRTVKRRRPNCICYILRLNCLLRHVIEGNVERAERRGRRHKQLLNDLKETRYWKLTEEAHTV